MQTVVRRRHGSPAEALETVTTAEPTGAPPGRALVRVALTPVHPGGLQAIQSGRDGAVSRDFREN